MVIIEKGTAGTPSNLFRIEPGLLGYVGKGSIAVVVIQNIMTPVGDKQIVEPIVVVVAYAHPLPPSHPNKPCLFAYISKGSITIVSKKPVSWCGGFRSLKGPSVDEKNILPTVVVVIKKGCAATRRFKNIF